MILMTIDAADHNATSYYNVPEGKLEAIMAEYGNHIEDPARLIGTARLDELLENEIWVTGEFPDCVFVLC